MCACLCDVQFYITYWNSYQFKIYFTANQLDIAAVRSLKDRMQSRRLSHIVFTGTLFASLYKHKEKKIPFQALIVLKKKIQLLPNMTKDEFGSHLCGLIITNSDTIRSFLSSASQNPDLSDELQQTASDLSSQSSIPYKALRNLWSASPSASRPKLLHLFSGSNFVLTSPKQREKVNNTQKRMKSNLRNLVLISGSSFCVFGTLTWFSFFPFFFFSNWIEWGTAGKTEEACRFGREECIRGAC